MLECIDSNREYRKDATLILNDLLCFDERHVAYFVIYVIFMQDHVDYALMNKRYNRWHE